MKSVRALPASPTDWPIVAYKTDEVSQNTRIEVHADFRVVLHQVYKFIDRYNLWYGFRHDSSVLLSRMEHSKEIRGYVRENGTWEEAIKIIRDIVEEGWDTFYEKQSNLLTPRDPHKKQYFATCDEMICTMSGHGHNTYRRDKSPSFFSTWSTFFLTRKIVLHDIALTYLASKEITIFPDEASAIRFIRSSVKRDRPLLRDSRHDHTRVLPLLIVQLSDDNILWGHHGGKVDRSKTTLIKAKMCHVGDREVLDLPYLPVADIDHRVLIGRHEETPISSTLNLVIDQKYFLSVLLLFLATICADRYYTGASPSPGSPTEVAFCLYVIALSGYFAGNHYLIDKIVDWEINEEVSQLRLGR